MLLKKLIENCFGQENPIPAAQAEIVKWQQWILPVSKKSAVGEDATYDDEYQFIRNEISRLTDIKTSEIITACENLLQNKSKDIRIITYYIWARLHQDGETGFADGISLLATLIDQYGEQLLPSRSTTRKTAFEWLASTKIQSSLSLYPEIEKNEIKRIVAALAWIQTSLKTWKEENRPRMEGLVSILEKRIESAGGIHTVVPQNSTTSSLSSSQDAPAPLQRIKSGRELLEQARFLSSYLREQPQGWLSSARLMRSIRWDSIHQLPDHNQEKQTRLAAPRSELKNALKRLYAQQKWAELLEQAEIMFMEGVNHFWLDIQWYVYQALCKSAGDHTEWSIIIKNDLKMILTRLPGLQDLTYDNGMPFADEVTQPWIEEQILADHIDVFTNQNKSLSQEQNNILDMEEEALSMIDREGENATFTWLMQLPGTDTVKNRWLQKLLMARITEQCGKNEMALHLLLELEKEGHPYNLSHWEPELMFEVKARLLKLLRMKSKNNESDKVRLLDKMEQLLSDLVSIDPARAFILFN